MDKYDAAESHYRDALKPDPGNALAAFNLAVALEDQGRIQEAVKGYQRTIEIDGQYADARFNLSRLLETGGDNRAARPARIQMTVEPGSLEWSKRGSANGAALLQRTSGHH